jgi:hypothetical protein
MKKISLSILALFFAIGLSAQVHFGVKGGLNFDNMKMKEIKLKNNNSTGWHAGVLLNVKLPLGFALQPEVLYSVKSIGWKDYMNTKVDNKVNFKYIEVPVNIQWGVDLILLRPFVLASPYFSYLLGIGNAKNKWEGVKDIDYGLGLGIGLDIWKLQITGKYNWGFGNLGNIQTGDWKVNDSTLRGFQLSVGILF